MNNERRIGLYGIALDIYWRQYKGLKERLQEYEAEIHRPIRELLGTEVSDARFLDTVEPARAVGNEFRSQNVNLIFLYISTYALSSTVFLVVQRGGIPVVVLNVQPVARIDYDAFNKSGDGGVMADEWLAHCQTCYVPEIASVIDAGQSNEDAVIPRVPLAPTLRVQNRCLRWGGHERSPHWGRGRHPAGRPRRGLEVESGNQIAKHVPLEWSLTMVETIRN